MITSVPRSWSWTGTAVQLRRCGFYSPMHHGRQNEASRKRHVQTTEASVESDSPSLGRVSGSSLLLEDLPIKTSSKILILSDTHASNLGGAGRRRVLIGGGVRGAHEESCGNDARLRQCWGGVGPSLFCPRRDFLPLLASMKPRGP